VGSLVEMGFSESHARTACLESGNFAVDAALAWLFEHPEPEAAALAQPEVEEGAEALESDAEYETRLREAGLALRELIRDTAQHGGDRYHEAKAEFEAIKAEGLPSSRAAALPSIAELPGEVAAELSEPQAGGAPSLKERLEEVQGQAQNVGVYVAPPVLQKVSDPAEMDIKEPEFELQRSMSFHTGYRRRNPESCSWNQGSLSRTASATSMEGTAEMIRTNSNPVTKGEYASRVKVDWSLAWTTQGPTDAR